MSIKNPAHCPRGSASLCNPGHKVGDCVKFVPMTEEKNDNYVMDMLAEMQNTTMYGIITHIFTHESAYPLHVRFGDKSLGLTYTEAAKI
jgi:hypothetical protein